MISLLSDYQYFSAYSFTEPITISALDGDTTYEVVSLEALPDYTGDFILYGVLADTDSSSGLRKKGGRILISQKRRKIATVILVLSVLLILGIWIDINAGYRKIKFSTKYR